MKLLAILLILSVQSSGLVTKNNGEQIKLDQIKVFQSQETKGGSMLTYVYRGKSSSINIGDLKRLNLKESLGKKKGVTTWKALIVNKKNEKLEVEIDLVEVTGINSEGKEVSYSFNVIDKISL